MYGIAKFHSIISSWLHSTGTAKQRNMTINFEPDNVQFPDTAVGETSVVKVKICNRSSTAHKV